MDQISQNRTLFEAIKQRSGSKKIVTKASIKKSDLKVGVKFSNGKGSKNNNTTSELKENKSDKVTAKLKEEIRAENLSTPSSRMAEGRTILAHNQTHHHSSMNSEKNPSNMNCSHRGITNNNIFFLEH